MKMFLFGVLFSFERFERYSVQVSFDVEQGFTERARFDTFRSAERYAKAMRQEEAFDNVGCEVYSRVVDRLTCRQVYFGSSMWGEDVQLRLTSSDVRYK